MAIVRRPLCTGLLLAILLTAQTAFGDEPLPVAGPTAQARHGMVVTVSRPASEVGADVLEQGGNAVDAAVATALALAVTWPEAGNIGGGGFMLIHPGGGQPPVVIDYREKPPRRRLSTCSPAASGRHM